MNDTYEKEAAKWDAMLCDPQSWLNVQEWARRFHWMMKRGMKIGNRTKSWRMLDLGCGTGEASWPLWKRVASVTFFDKSAAMLRLARNKYPKGIFVRGDAMDLPFLDGEFDVVVSRGCLISQVCEDDAEAIKFLHGIFRVMRPGGYMMFDFVMDAKKWNEADAPALKSVWSHDKLLKILGNGVAGGWAVIAKDGLEAHMVGRLIVKRI